MKNKQSILLSVCLLTIAAAGSGAGQEPQGGASKEASGGGPSPQPAYKVLYSFTGGADGGNPNFLTGAGLLRDIEGNLYGTAYEGGLINSNCPTGCGVVFKIDRTGKETVLHAFSGSPDGASPATGLIMDLEGNLFGTTTFGGAQPLSVGTVFKVDRLGHETVLHSFGGSPDGNVPSSSLTLDIWGNLYGTTIAGGSWGSGVVFKLDSRGRETILHSFAGPDGESPGSNLTWDDRGIYTAPPAPEALRTPVSFSRSIQVATKKWFITSAAQPMAARLEG